MIASHEDEINDKYNDKLCTSNEVNSVKGVRRFKVNAKVNHSRLMEAYFQTLCSLVGRKAGE